MKKQSVKYRRATVLVETNYKIRNKKCSVCGRKGVTQLHHWKYKYTTKQVKENHILALEETQELCFFCHRIANAMKLCDDNPNITLQLNKSKECI